MNEHRRFLRVAALSAALALAMSTSVNAATQSPAPAARFTTSSLQQGQSYDRFIVTYRPGSTERRDHAAAVQNVGVAIARSGLNRATHTLNGQAVPALGVTYRRKLAVGADLLQTTRKLSDAEATILMRQIASDPAVQFVEPDAVMHPIDSVRTSAVRRAAVSQPAAFPQDPPDDSKYQQYQWDFFSATGGVNAPAAWSLADGTGVTVAVLDTGLTKNADIDYSLGDSGYDFLSSKDYSGRAADGRATGGWDTGDWTAANECGSGAPAENSSWHGTHVSGTIAALTNNGIALAGMAGMAKVLPVRVLGHCGGPTSDIADGIVWAAGGHVDGVPENQHPAKVISMSLGGGGYCYSDSAFAMAIKQANDLGAAVVVAAGNDGSNTENYQPASCPGVIAVAATGIDGGKAQYSNYGKAVALAAPGGGICPDDHVPDTGGSCGGNNPRDDGFVWSLVNSGTTAPADDVGDGYVYFGGMAGTSQATPHVSATLALILDAMQSAGLPSPTPVQLKGFLADSVRPFPIVPPSGTPIGPGILDAAAAVNLAIGNDPGEQVTALTNAVPVGNLYGATGDEMLFSLVVPAGARNLSLRSFGGMGDVSLYVSRGHAPTTDSHDYQSNRIGNNESVVIRTPQPGTYYVLIKADTTFSNLGVLGNYSP
ncbi:S8 family serine peptidase [Rhodanobacter sp. Col0626]|uniref:S8 family serine peptidase n=1 Tax=Rhodanobacter sp. Col0626 TaxID=3415679 RepID=UPI003CF23FDA